MEKNSERKIDAPFSEWGASVVLSGHLHVYERFNIDGIPYITNGLGGDVRYKFIDEQPESIVRFSEAHGGIFAEASKEELSIKFVTINGEIIDKILLKK